MATTIDGSHGEGGGQILRNACTYAAILRKNVRIVNIRAGRKTPGLRPQHLVGLRLLEAASGGYLAEGNHIGSTEIMFVGSSSTTNCDSNSSFPASKKNNSCGDEKREYVGDTQTAGSVCLLMQTIVPFALFRGRNGNGDDDEILKFVLKGGTDAAFAPPIDYNRYLFLPVLRNYTCWGGGEIDAKNEIEELKHAIDISLVRRGFYPRGGGEVHMAIHRLSSKNFPLPPIRLTERGAIVGITVRTFAAGNFPPSMDHELSTTIQKMIAANPRYNTVPITIDMLNETSTDRLDKGKKRPRSIGSGCGVLITAQTATGCLLGGSSIGYPKIPLEETARLATKDIVEAMDGGGCVDEYLQDQLILYMALAGGVSEIVTNSLTLHTKSAIWLALKMLPSVRFEVTKLGTTQDGAQNKRSLGEAGEMSLGAARNDDSMGKSIPGCHRIRCHGIGFCPPSN